MSGWIPPRLRPLVGVEFHDIDEGSLENLIGVVEDTEIEFKREPYGPSDGQAKEAAYDLAAMANAEGGLLVIGVSEDGEGRATGLLPIATAQHDVGLWLDQVVASRIFPALRIHQRAVPVQGGVVLVVSVGASIAAPHAVAVGDGALRYPVRSGKSRRPLTEAEVADRYRQRLAGLDQQAAILDRMTDRGESLVPGGDSQFVAWLVLAAVPDLPGGMSLRRGTAEEWRDRVGEIADRFPSFGPRGVHHGSIGFRCIYLTDDMQARHRPYSFGGEFNLDGSGVLVFGYFGAQGDHGVAVNRVAVYDEFVAADVINGIAILAEHALRTHARGLLNISATLHAPGNVLSLAQPRSQFPGVIGGTHPMTGSPNRSRHSVPIDTLVQPGPDTVATARLVLSDIFSAFGLPEPQQITADAQLVESRFQRDWTERVKRWAQDASVEMIADLPG